jgi:hypothetical protein
MFANPIVVAEPSSLQPLSRHDVADMRRELSRLRLGAIRQASSILGVWRHGDLVDRREQKIS